MRNEIANGNVQIIGLDGSSYVTMLQFDTANSGNATFSGDLTVSGNLSVTGTTTQNNSVSTAQKTITLASGAANNAAVDGAGIVVDAGSDTDKTLKWLDSTDRWTFTGGDVSANAFYGDGSNLTGLNVAITAINNASNNRIVTSNGGTTVNSEANLTFDGSILQNAGSYPRVRVKNTGTSASAGDVFGAIEFEHSDADDAGITAKIQAMAEDNVGKSFLAFYNNNGGNADERLRITSDGVLSWRSSSTPLSGSGNNYSVNIYRDSGLSLIHI